MKNKIRMTDIALIVLSALFLAGNRTLFGACGPKEDGSFMTCHWAGEALFGAACLLMVLALLHLVIFSRSVRMGLDLAIIAASAYAMAVPGILIHLCMMPSMHCRMVMRPASIAFSVLILSAAALDLVMREKKGSAS